MKTQKQKHQSYTVFILLLIFGIFLTSAWEDRTFKDWKNKNLSLFHQYLDIEYLCHRDLNTNERFLLDLSVMQNVYQPFDKKLFGPIRRFVYLRIVPEIKETLSLLRNGESGILFASTGKAQKFEFISNKTFSNIGQLDKNDFSKIRDFMKEYNIKYYVCYFGPNEWRQKKNLLARNGFTLVYNNPHFMLFNGLE